MAKGTSMAGRAFIAVALMIGFYALALAIAGALVALPILEVVYAGRIHIKLAVLAVVGAGVILWSIVPRPDRFTPPGPLLTPEGHPQLFRVLRSVAKAVGQPMPKEVYAVSDVNAFVTQRGGFMGFGGRRVMGLGLPLMQALTVGEMRAVLAHEFGHFHGGDTKLGPWIYKTRGALGRTITSLHEANSSILHVPFEWYGSLFLRITHAISRAQEYAADRLAAAKVGARPLAEGLRKIHGAAAAFDGYWSNELGPILNDGYRPPMMAGFKAFLSSPRVKVTMGEMVDEAMTTDHSDPYDTHPPLPERLAALDDMADKPVAEGDDEPAIELLGDLDTVERALLVTMAGSEENANALKSASWEDLPDQYFVPTWREGAKAFAARYGGLGLTLAGFADRAGDAAQLARESYGEDASGVPAEILAGSVGSGLATQVLVALLDAGWEVEMSPGESVRLRSRERTVEPFQLAGDLVKGELPPARWRELLSESGVGELSVASFGGAEL